MINHRLIAVVLLTLMPASLAYAANNNMTGVTVNKLRSYQKGQNGGCVFGISGNVNTEGSNAGGISCAKDMLVTADCSGRARSKGDGLAMWETAQIAFVLGKKIDILVSDDADLVGSDGICVAKTVFLSKSSGE